MIAMDVAMHFTFSHSTLTEMDGFCTDDVENIADAVKYKAVGKFEAKVLVWCVVLYTLHRDC
jgi:hypothetical protein